jgi:hypothetical protein
LVWAEKAILIRGMLEIHVKDIVLVNMLIQSNYGMDIQETLGITFRNIQVESKHTKPVIDIIQSDNLVFDNIRYTNGADLLFRVSGDRTEKITIRNTDAAQSKEKIKNELGATEKVIAIK